MTAAMITQLLIAFGPSAIGLIENLVQVWDKPSLTVQEVLAITAIAGKSYNQYILDAGGNPTPTVVKSS